MKSFVTGWMSHGHISYGIIRVGLRTHIGRGTLNPSIGTPIPSITSDMYRLAARRTKKIGEKATTTVPLLSTILMSLGAPQKKRFVRNMKETDVV